MSLLRKLRAFFRKERLDAEMAEEMHTHLELQTEQNISRGMSEAEARYAARRTFGAVEQIKERARDQRGWIWFEQTVQDFRYAFRQLAKSRGFTTVAVLSLALGIGANTAIFGLVDAVLLRSLPVRNPGELVLLDWSAPPTKLNDPNGRWANGLWGGGAFSLLSFDRLRADNHTLTGLFGFRGAPELNVVIEGHAHVIDHGQYVTGNYFEVLGVRPLLGRMLLPADDQAEAPPVVVISDRLWQHWFDADPAAIGKTILINKVPCVVVGVTPPEFSGTLEVGEAADVTLPVVHMAGARDQLARASNHWWLRLMGRMKPGVTREQAQADLAGLFRESVAAGIASMPRVSSSPPPDERYWPRLKVEPGGQGLMGNRAGYQRSLFVLIGLVVLVLLIACANVANLLLARGAARRKEIGVRLALGAGRGRVVRQLLAESIVLALFGGLLGVLFAWWGKDFLVAMHPLGWGGPGFVDLRLDARVLGFTLAVAVVTTLLSGLVPALRTTGVNVAEAFQGATRGAGGASRPALRLARGLMIGQVALSVILLVGAVLFVRTLRNLHREGAGFNRENLLLFRVDATPAGYTPAAFVALRAHLLEKIEAVPGVRSVTMSTIPVLGGAWNARPFWLPGTPAPQWDKWPKVNAVDARFFDTLGIPLTLGRAFGPNDCERAQPVAIINQTLARQFFGEENPLGRRFSLNPGDGTPRVEVIGVVQDIKYADVREAAPPTFYLPFVNENLNSLNMNWAQMNFAVRTAGDPGALIVALPELVRGVDGTLPITDVRTMDQQVARLFAKERIFAQLSGCFGLLAVALAGVGLYGLISFAVVRRTGEIGVRMALGAMPGQVLRMILREAFVLVSLGVAAGMAVSAGITRFVAGMFYGLSPTDPLTYGAVTLGLAAVALFASWLPARRASKVEPMVALRTE